MGAYAAGATVERRYPGPSQETARAAAEPQVQAFVAAGWKIGGERWVDDAGSGAPIGDAIATGAVSYLAGSGGNLVITYVAVGEADLPVAMPVYTEQDPRAAALEGFATLKVIVGVVGIVIFLLFFFSILGQMGHMQQSLGGPGTIIYDSFPPAP